AYGSSKLFQSISTPRLYSPATLSSVWLQSSWPRRRLENHSASSPPPSCLPNPISVVPGPSSRYTPYPPFFSRFIPAANFTPPPSPPLPPSTPPPLPPSFPRPPPPPSAAPPAVISLPTPSAPLPQPPGPSAPNKTRPPLPAAGSAPPAAPAPPPPFAPKLPCP